jgi:hypothetical protein
MGLLGPVFDVRSAVAVRPAAAQLGVPIGEVAVRGERRGLDLEQLEVPLEQLVDGCSRLRVPLLVDLDREPAQGLLRVRRGGRPGGDQLAEVVPPSRQRVDTGIDLDAQRPARQLLDLTPLPSLLTCRRASHNSRLGQLAPRIAPRERKKIEPAECFLW